MEKITNDDISDLLEKWNDVKTEMSNLEKKLEKYKLLASKIMDFKDLDEISNSRFILKRNDISRQSLSKTDVPSSIWKEYSKKIEYTSFTLKTKNNVKDKLLNKI